MVHQACFAGWLVAAVVAQSPAADPVFFVRGDVNQDGAEDLSDAVALLNHLFQGGAQPACRSAGDVNDDNGLDLSDAVYQLSALFLGGASIPAPYPDCGDDPTAGELDCREFLRCEWPSVAARYGTLVTIAGSGTLDDGVNGWEPRFEGGPATAADLSNPHMAMADAAGNVYVADKEAHAIRKVTAKGTIHTVAGVNSPDDDGDEPGPAAERSLYSPNGVWVRADGTFYVLDTDNGKVRRVGTDGIMTTLFSHPGEITVGRGLWVRDDERLAYFVSSTNVNVWSPEQGSRVYAAGFSSPANLVVSPAGDLVVADRGLHQVFKVHPDGSKVAIAGNGLTSGGGDGELALETGLFGVRGVWFFPDGGYVLATHQGSQIWYVDRSARIHLFLDGADNEHSGDGEHYQTPGKKVSECRAVTVDTQGNVIITESDRGYVRVVKRR